MNKKSKNHILICGEIVPNEFVKISETKAKIKLDIFNSLSYRAEQYCISKNKFLTKQILKRISTEQLNKTVELINEELKKRRINNVNKN